MESSASPAAVSRPQIRARFTTLAACAGLAVLSASCSTSSPVSPGYVSASGAVQVSSIQSGDRTADTEWNPDSLPFSGDARDPFNDLGPDYFADLLRNIPEVD